MTHHCTGESEGPIISDTPAPNHILDVGFAFRKSKVLLSAVELGLFTVLAEGPLSCEALVERLWLHPRGGRDFFDALVALKLVARDANGVYSNVPECATYLDARKPTYIGHLFEYLNARVYRTWDELTPALRTGEPQRGALLTGEFSSFYADNSTADMFLKGMTGGSRLVGRALANAIAWQDHKTVVDVGTAQGSVLAEIASAHPHILGIGFDLPVVERAFIDYVQTCDLGARLTFRAGDFFRDQLPPADVYVLGKILHDWDITTRKFLLSKAYRALSDKGVVIVHDSLIDDERRHRPDSLLASLNMLIQTPGGSEYTAKDCTAWMREAGFSTVHVIELTAMQSAVIGYKGNS